MPLTQCWTDRVPSLNREASEQLENLITPESKVFEFGTGGSTIWLAGRVKELVSVEHNKAWFNILKEGFISDFGEIPGNVIILLLNRTLNDRWIVSETTGENIGLDFTDYILRYPDDYFDLVIVDGRARNSCIANSLSKVKPGGYIMLDDVQRPCYAQGIAMLSEWEKTICKGDRFTPYEGNGTIFFKRPEV